MSSDCVDGRGENKLMRENILPKTLAEDLDMLNSILEENVEQDSGMNGFTIANNLRGAQAHQGLHASTIFVQTVANGPLSVSIHAHNGHDRCVSLGIEIQVRRFISAFHVQIKPMQYTRI